VSQPPAPAELHNEPSSRDGISIGFVGGFNDSGGGLFAVANFASGAARLNPEASVGFFPWNKAGSLSAWIRERRRATAVIGQSLGGHVAANIAIAYPGRIETLVTIDPVSPPFFAPRFTWEELRNSVTRWIHIVQGRSRILAFAAHRWGDAPAPFADGFVATDFSHGDFFSTIRHLKGTEGLLPGGFNWNVES